MQGFFVLLILAFVAIAQAGLLGGRNSVDINDKDLLSAAKFASDKLDGKSVKVISGTQQVVAGML